MGAQPTSLREALIQARDLISDPARHNRNGHYAVDAYGDPIESDSDRACRWCAVGALKRVCRDSYHFVPAGRALLADVADAQHGVSHIRVNDTMSHEATMVMFEAAIAKAEVRCG